MRFSTQTSQYELAQTQDGKFVLTKLHLRKGEHSMVSSGRSFIGDLITITRNGLEINTPTGMKTSPIKLPVVHIEMVNGEPVITHKVDILHGQHINVHGSPYTTLPDNQKTALDR